ncbi:type VII secretion integral membrane protein EccD [Mycolicibacterium tusciae]|uniref:type VII secretion integral membrane protein EccD n=1 Tax=Mycolicibacterium tusciae TaxID=75922 RepID=UPI00024A3F6B|nr:type VII secretion integral membrane protein EccD [Mycolicibacterium tusciae]
MPDSLCPLTVAVCTADTHRAIDLTVPADIHIGQLLPQIVEIVHRDADPDTARDWRLSRLGDLPMDESMTLNDNDVRAGEVLILTTAEPPVAEWVDYDPCHAAAAGAAVAPIPRILPAVCCVLFGGFGAVALVLPAARATATGLVTGTCLAVGAAVGAAVVARIHGDPLACVSLSMIAALYAGVIGFLSVPAGSHASGLLLASAAMMSAAILLVRVTGCGRVCLTALATVSGLVAASSAATVTWSLQLNACGAALATLSLATLAFAPRLSMTLSGTAPDAAPDVGLVHRNLTGLVVGSSIGAALGATGVVISEVRDAGSALRGTAFGAIVALVLLLRVRSHVDSSRRIGLAGAAVLTGAAGFAAVVISYPPPAQVVGALAATAGAAALGCVVRPTVSPIALRAVEVAEYLALAAVVPLACWVGGIYGWAREMNLI